MRQTDRSFADASESARQLLEDNSQTERSGTQPLPSCCAMASCQPGETSRIWGTVAMSVKACELTDNATRFNLATEISPFLHLCSGSDLSLAQILFAPSLAGGVYVPVLKACERIARCAKLCMTKNYGHGRSGKDFGGAMQVPVCSLSVQCVGDSTDSQCFHSTATRYIIWRCCPCLSFLILSRSCFHYPTPLL